MSWPHWCLLVFQHPGFQIKSLNKILSKLSEHIYHDAHDPHIMSCNVLIFTCWCSFGLRWLQILQYELDWARLRKKRIKITGLSFHGQCLHLIDALNFAWLLWLFILPKHYVHLERLVLNTQACTSSSSSSQGFSRRIPGGSGDFSIGSCCRITKTKVAYFVGSF